jgi:beta-barrel assembly-enhancing protease
MKPAKPFRHFLSLASLGLMAATLSQCAWKNTAESFLVSDADEARLGLQFDAELRTQPAEYPVFQANTPRKEQFVSYVNTVFDKVLANVPANQRPKYGFHLTIVDKPVINAFAVPGGYIYLYTGIIDSMKSESELAGVLAHEVSHVTHHHYRDALIKVYGINILADVLAGSDSTNQIKAFVKKGFTTLASLKVSRSNESEADAYGTRYLGFAGWDPYGISDLFSRMPSSGFAWLSTHPAPTNRVKDVKDLVHSEGEGQNGQPAWNAGAKNANAFLEQKANMRN